MSTLGVTLRQTLLKNFILLLIPLLLLSACNKDKATALSQCKTDITNEGIAEEKESAHWALCMKKHGYDLIRKNAPPMCQDIPLNTHANIDCYEPMPFKERLREFIKRAL